MRQVLNYTERNFYHVHQEKVEDSTPVKMEPTAPEEEISLTSSEEVTLPKTEAGDEAGKKTNQEQNSIWEMRESIEITLTAQPEDTVMAEERLEIAEVCL